MSDVKALEQEMAQLKKNSFRVISQLNGKIKKLEAEKENQEPIAIIGMSCRLPGASNSPEALWQLLSTGTDGIEPIPESRWNIDEWYDSDPDTPGKMYVKEGGFLSDIESFDASFFKITPQEAKSIDPQQRLLLECSWEALERAGLRQQDLSASSTGVYIGMSGSEYLQRALSDAQQIDAYSLLGGTHSTISGRVSYWLGLTGPNMSVDTACSSSLVSLHLGVQALRQGECDQALVGGANLILDPAATVYFSTVKSLSPDGRCHSFSNKANGFARSEGAGVLVLKPLSKAQADGDNILALVRGTAVNQDGKSQGFTAPNGPSQQAVIKKALKQSKLEPADIDYIECHGTGTDLGDPIEVQSLGAVFRQKAKPVVLGSIKSNIGHAEAAAGVAGVIKAVLSLQNELIPKSLHSEELNEKIDWDQYQVKVAQEAMPWKKGEKVRRAGVSSFGISGTNAHVIVEEAPAPQMVDEGNSDLKERPFQLFPVSADSNEALPAQLSSLNQHVGNHPHQSITALAHGLSKSRTHFGHRSALVASDRQALLSQLVTPVEDHSTQAGKLAFLYTGGGAQYVGMGLELYETEPVFKSTFDECLQLIKAETGEDFKPIIFADAGSEIAKKLDEMEYMLLALYTVEYSLTRLWQHWGIEPDVLMGHSLGEIVAATVAGVFSLADGIKLVAARGKLMASVKRPGKMATVEASLDELTPFLNQVADVSIAGENGPRQTLISGAAEGVLEMVKMLDEADFKVKVLPISQGSHSLLMEEILPAFQKVAEQITYHAPKYALISNVSGKLASEEIQSAAYWTGHIRQTVLFSSGMQTLETVGVTHYLEMGPQPNLTGMGAHCVSNSEHCLWLPSLLKEGSDVHTMLTSLGTLFSAGYDPDWSAFYQDRRQPKVALPTYAFQRKRYWIEPKKTSSAGAKTGHPLLGNEIDIAGQKIFEQELNLKDFPYMADHKVMDQLVVPGAGLAELVQGFIHIQEEDLELTELLMAEPLILPWKGSIKVQLVTEEIENGYRFKLHSKATNGDWQLHGSGSVTQQTEVGLTSIDPQEKKSGLTLKDTGKLYDDFAALGKFYGPVFQGLEEVYADEQRAFGKIVLRAEDQLGHLLHPALLDGAFQMFYAIDNVKDDSAYLPFEVSGYRLLANKEIESLWAEVTLGESTKDQKQYHLQLWDESGEPLAQLENVAVRKVDINSLSQSNQVHANWLYTAEWESVNLAPVSMKAGQWTLSTELRSETGTFLASALPAAGVEITEQKPEEELRSGNTGLISLWEAKDHSPDLPGQVEQYSALALSQLQSAVNAGVEEIVWITKGVHADNANLLQSGLWGLLRVAMNEYPDIKFRLIDIADETAATHAQLLAAISSQEEDQLKLESGAVLGLRLKQKTTRNLESSIAAYEGTTLITGGLGALGLKLAEHLTTNYQAEHLLLLGRSKPKAEALELISRLEAAGTKVTVHSCDVADRQSLETVIKAIPKAYPLKAVIHAAGVLDDGILSEQNQERLHKSMLPKVYGGWHLHELTQALDLRQFVLFSSAVSWIGSAGQANYAAANLFLDQLTQFRKSQGLVSHSINWGPVSDVGLAAQLSDADRQRIEQTGMGYFKTSEGLALFDEILKDEVAQVGIMPFRKNQLGQFLRKHRGEVPALYKHIVAKKKSREGSQKVATQILNANPLEQKQLILNFLKQEMSAVTHRDMSHVDVQLKMAELGLNSLQVIEIANVLRRKLNVKFPVSVIFDSQGMEGLADFLLKKLNKVAFSKYSSSYNGIHEFKNSGSTAPIFCAPGLGAMGFYYRYLFDNLKGDAPFYAFNSLAYRLESMPTSVEDVADIYLEYLLEKQPKGPYVMLGHSFGSQISYRLTQLLEERGEKVEQLILLDAIFAGVAEKEVEVKPFDLNKNTIHYLKRFTQVFNLEGLPEPESLEEWVAKGEHYEWIQEQLFPIIDLFVDKNDLQSAVNLLIRNDYLERKMAYEYGKNANYSTINAPITLLRTRLEPNPDEDPKQWMQFEFDDYDENLRVIESLTKGGLQVEMAAGNHISMLNADHSPKLGELIRACLGQGLICVD